MSVGWDISWRRHFQEQDAVLPHGARIHYAVGPDSGPPLLLIHGQTGCWRDYGPVLSQLSHRWQVFAVDCYGHGRSSHDPSLYSLQANGEDLLWLIREVIGRPAAVSGHSSGGLLAAYVAARGQLLVLGALLEDPPVFSTEPDFFPRSFAFQDTYAPLHRYLLEHPAECWEAYYLRHCLWGRLFLPKGTAEKLARYAQRFRQRRPLEEPVRFFLPGGINDIFRYLPQYDLAFGEAFYNYSWHSGIPHRQLMGEIRVPTVFLHCKDAYTEDGILLAAASDLQAQQAADLMKNCRLVTISSPHNIHRAHSKQFLQAMEQLSSML